MKKDIRRVVAVGRREHDVWYGAGKATKKKRPTESEGERHLKVKTTRLFQGWIVGEKENKPYPFWAKVEETGGKSDDN